MTGQGAGEDLTCKVASLAAHGAGGLGKLGVHFLAAQMAPQATVDAERSLQILCRVLLLAIPALVPHQQMSGRGMVTAVMGACRSMTLQC